VRGLVRRRCRLPASRLSTPLPESGVRSLVEQVTATRLEISRLAYGCDGGGREHGAIADRHSGVEREILDAEEQLVAARRTLEEHDRPLERRVRRRGGGGRVGVVGPPPPDSGSLS